MDSRIGNNKGYFDLSDRFFEELEPILTSRDQDKSPINIKHHLDRAEAGYIGLQSFSGECPECKQYVVEDYSYCPFCGQALKWDSSELLKLPKEN